jgi:sigma54-dependent transcription regulator
MVVRYPSSRFHFGEGERINLDKKEVHQMRTKHCLAGLGHVKGDDTTTTDGRNGHLDSGAGGALSLIDLTITIDLLGGAAFGLA